MEERTTIERWKRMSEPWRLLCDPNAASWSRTDAYAMRSSVSFAANGLQSKRAVGSKIGTCTYG